MFCFTSLCNIHNEVKKKNILFSLITFNSHLLFVIFEFILKEKEQTQKYKIMSHKKRIDYFAIAPEAMKGMLELEKYVHGCGLEPLLIELIKTRVSQINKCAYCVDMHTKDARHLGETEQRLYGLSAWRETPFYSDRERAGLEWAEALTLLPQNEVSDELYNTVSKHFSEKEIVNLSTAIVAINGWNRYGVGFRSEAGTYQPK